MGSSELSGANKRFGFDGINASMSNMFRRVGQQKSAEISTRIISSSETDERIDLTNHPIHNLDKEINQLFAVSCVSVLKSEIWFALLPGKAHSGRRAPISE
jgi:hypothetical protein